MDSEGIFRLAFWVLIGLMILMRIWFAIRVRRAGERLMPDQAAIRREGWRIYAIRLFVFLLLVALIVLLVRNPTWWPKLDFPLPFWLRWAGFALGLAGLGLWTWTHVALGTLWSAQLQLRANHRLVTSGPYSSTASHVHGHLGMGDESRFRDCQLGSHHLRSLGGGHPCGAGSTGRTNDDRAVR